MTTIPTWSDIKTYLVYLLIFFVELCSFYKIANYYELKVNDHTWLILLYSLMAASSFALSTWVRPVMFAPVFIYMFNNVPCKEFSADIFAALIGLQVAFFDIALQQWRKERRQVKVEMEVDAVDIDGQQGRMREAFARCLMSFHKGVDGTTLRFLCPGQWHHERHHSHHNIDHYSDPDNGWIAVFPRLLLFCTHNRLPDDTFEFQLHHTVRLDDGQEKWVRVRRRLFTFPAQPRKNSNNNGNNNGRAQAAIEEGISFRPAAHVDERFVLGAFIGCGRLKADIEDGAQ